MKCQKHPDYQVKRAPTTDCDTCKQLWREKQSQDIASVKYQGGQMKL